LRLVNTGFQREAIIQKEKKIHFHLLLTSVFFFCKLKPERASMSHQSFITESMSAKNEVEISMDALTAVLHFFDAVKKDTEYNLDRFIPLKLHEIPTRYSMQIPTDVVEKIFDDGEIVNKTHNIPIRSGRIITPEMAVEQFQLLIISGPPGSGKTMLINYLTHKFCTENIEIRDADGFYAVPIPITLREFVREKKSLRAAIDSFFEKYSLATPEPFVEKILTDGKALLLLDGFDELTGGSNDEQEQATTEILAFRSRYPAARILVTSRPTISHDIPPGFKLISIMEFDQSRIKRYIDNRVEEIGRKRTSALQKIVGEDIMAAALAKTPLFLSIITALYTENMELPRNRAELLRRITDSLLCDRDAGKQIKHRFTSRQMEFILRKLAFRCHSENRRILGENEILMTIGEFACEIGLKQGDHRPFLDEIYRRTHILAKVTIDTYRFHLLAFQEYYTALELKTQEDAFDTLLPHLAEPWWEEPILLYARISGNTNILIKRLREDVPEDIFFTRLMLMGRCMADADTIDTGTVEKIAVDIWQLYNRSEFPLLKEKAMSALSRLKPRNIIDILADQLTDGAPLTRKTAVDNLGQIGRLEDLPALIMVLVKDGEKEIRARAAAALGKAGSPEAVLPLKNALHIDREVDVRKSAAEALGDIGSFDSMSVLIDALTSDKSSTVRGTAAEALGKVGNIEALPHLIRALTTERESAVRWRIAIALGRLQGSDARDVLIEALAGDRDGTVRESAAEALGWIGSEECTRALIRALSADGDADVRGSAAYALGYIGSEDAVPVLIKALITDTNGEVRGRAAYALGRIKKVEAVPYLTAVFSGHKESIIRGNATYALGEIGGVEAIPFLIQAITLDKDAYVRYRAAEVLGHIGNIMAIPPLQTALKDEGSYYGWRVKDKAFESLEKISRRLGVRIGK
jgi:HEAT repeat protein